METGKFQNFSCAQAVVGSLKVVKNSASSNDFKCPNSCLHK